MQSKEIVGPEVRITHGKFLDPVFIGYARDKYGNTTIIPPLDEVRQKISRYQTEWKSVEQSVLSGLQEATALTFHQNTIDVFIVSVHERAFSNPMVMPAKYAPDSFVDSITHELIHRLFSDNAQRIDFQPIWQGMFPEHPIIVRNHIFVHAVHEHIYRNVLQDEKRLARNIARYPVNDAHNAYGISWKIVLEKGYREILGDLRYKYPHRSIH